MKIGCAARRGKSSCVIVTLEFNGSDFDLYVTPWVSVTNSQQKFVSVSRYFLPSRLFYIRDNLLWHAATVSPFTYFVLFVLSSRTCRLHGIFIAKAWFYTE